MYERPDHSACRQWTHLFRLLRTGRATRWARGPMAIEVCESSQLAKLAAERIAEALKTAILRDSAASLALAGGTTPRAAYEALAKIPGIDWSKVSVYFGDERAVPPTHPDSNFGMAQAALFARVPLLAANIHRMVAEDPDQDAA